ncbi:probable cytochrome P450 6a13 isoform X2 [Sipha flava]|uniref:Probable cytochrome P450 6a13 isoform X2 n=1 Tax=Sipha flava TaxID=143950 RepID=A0A8B8G220_9HEMI|nr:probable cytochrome P450 6a13 isoform X2 [Sipha flava]
MKLEHQVDTFDRIYKQFPDEKYCGLYKMKTPYLMIRDPELINKIIVKDFSYFTDRGFDGVYTDPAINVMANSLLFLKGQKWRMMRQKLKSGFTPNKIISMHDKINECAEHLMKNIDEKLKHTDQIQVKQAMGNYSTDVIGTCVFGLKLDTIKNDNSEFRKHAKKIFHQSRFKLFLIQILQTISLKLVKSLKLQLFPRDSTTFFYSVFKSVINHREENNVVKNDLTQILVEAKKELLFNDNLTDKNKFMESDIIALNKHVQDKLRKEINTNIEKHGAQLNNNFIMDLHYANMVLNETARMYSITCVLLREATKMYNVPDEPIIIEKGQKIIIPLYNIHNDPKYYPDPQIFNPERFSTEQNFKRMNGTFIPFGDGPRMCLGKRLAEIEMLLILSKVLTKYEILPCEKTEIPLDIKNGSGFISSKNEIWLNFKLIA